MHRAYVSISANELACSSESNLLGQLTQRLPFAIEPTQRTAWEYQIRHLRELAIELPNAHFFLEFLIPRMGRRVDLVAIVKGVIFVVEYKIGARHFDKASLEQVYGYGLDLKHFHETSHRRPVVPVLVATEAAASKTVMPEWDEDLLARPLAARPTELPSLIRQISGTTPTDNLDPMAWLRGNYRPTPTIVEAAQALYSNHDVREIARSEAGAENLTRTTDYITSVIESAKRSRGKAICFVTGVPGSGKTLAGLNLATSQKRLHPGENAVFLSGNGPLVQVLREALARDSVVRARDAGRIASKSQEDRRAATLIQNIHHFRDEALASGAAPTEKVAIFDEAQRAWDVEQTSRFMRQKKGQANFQMSEPEFLLKVMDRHPDWCTVVCLVGSGQEINTGEAGIEEWFRALRSGFQHWQVHLPTEIQPHPSFDGEVIARDLHLATSIRSFRAERLSDFVGHVIDGDSQAAALVQRDIRNYPLWVTRDLAKARNWLRNRRRGNERAGLLASSNGARLKPHGIFVKARIEPTHWFLAPPTDVRSSDALEDAATEFDVQGLEVDWAGVCWDANLRRSNAWESWRFKGSRWERVSDPARQRYLQNSYRVLLTRARQGLVVFIPHGDAQDTTRAPELYASTYAFLRDCGFQEI